jgi:hypothetical protein
MAIPSPGLQYSVVYVRPSLASDPADGAFYRGGSHTVEHRIFKLHWPVIKEAEFEALELDFNTRVGPCEVFSWTTPVIAGAEAVRVAYVAGSLKGQKVSGVIWTASVDLEEDLIL